MYLPVFADLMAQPSRTLTTRGVITYPDSATQEITATNIIRWRVNEDAGDHLPLGGVAAASLELTLDNRAREWDAGGSILGTHSLDGAYVSLELGIQHPDYTAPTVIDGGAPSTVYTESYDGGTPASTYTETLDGGDALAPDEWYWCPIGTYKTEDGKAQEQDTLITIKGMDKLGNDAGVAFVDSLTYPATLLQIIQSACSQAGITFTGAFLNSDVLIPQPLWDKPTCRDVISYVACCAAGFARINRLGLLEIVPLKQRQSGYLDYLMQSSFDIVDGELFFTTPAEYALPVIELIDGDLYAWPKDVELVDGDIRVIGESDGTNYFIYPSRYKRIDKQGPIFGGLNSITVYAIDEPDIATRVAVDLELLDNELNSVAVSGNPILATGAAFNTIVSNMLTSMSGVTYSGAKVDWQGDPQVENGSFATVSDLSGAIHHVLVLSQTLSYDNGFGMVSGNKLNSKTKGEAKKQYMRVFTPSGMLNAAALEGDITIKAGRKLNLLAGSDMEIKAGGKITVESSDGIVLSAGTGIDTALNGKLGANSPAVGVQTSYIEIDTNRIHASTDDFLIKNAAGETMLSVSDLNGADEGGGQLVIGSPEMPMKIGGNYVLPVESGGTGTTTNRVWYVSSYPQNEMGKDGDLAVLANAPDQSGSYSEISPALHSVSGNTTFAGLARNWNDVSVSGYVRSGNGNATGQTNLKAAAWAFTAPANLSAVPITFNSVKFISPTWYGWSTSLPITVAIVDGSGTILGTTTFVPGTASQANSVSVPAAVTASTVYYIIMYDAGTSASKSVCLIDSVKIPAYAGNSAQYSVALFIKSFGMWTLIAGGNG